MSGLLEYIFGKTYGLEFLSDLQYTDMWQPAVEVILPSDFPLKEWNEAVQYLCRTDRSFDTAEEARAYLLEHRPGPGKSKAD